MLQPKKSTSKKELDKYLKSSFKQELESQKQDEINQFKSNYTPTSNKYKKQLQERNNNTSQLKQDNSTEKDKEFNKNYHDKKEWDSKKWNVYENIATTAELGNFVPHPVAQAVGKAGSIASVALSARKAKLAYDNQDYVNMGLNLGMMGLSGKMGSTTFAKNTVKSKNLDSFEKLIAPKEFKSNIVNGYEIGRMETKVPSYINVLDKKSGQSVIDLNKNRALLGVAGADYSTDFNTKQEQNTQFAMGGNINNNMNRYAQGGDLTRFDTGGQHSENPLGGIPIGGNNSVEENETKSGNFIYSNRIFLDSNIVSQYNLPKSLVGKSVADATKLIDNKFKGRNDKISQSTKNGMLSKIAEAQEAMKPQEPEMEQPQEGIEQGYPQEMMDNGQMAFGGFKDSTIGQGFGKEATGAQQSEALGAGLGVATSALDLGMTAFGKPAQDTSGLAASAPVDKVGMIGGSALKGATAGMAFGPAGAGIGALVGAGAGLLGANKARKAATENSNNFALNTNNKLSDNYFAMGGKMNQMGDGGDYLKNNRPFYMTNPGPTTITPTIGKTGFYGPDRIPKQMFNDSTEPINIPEQVIKPTQTQAEFENYANQHQTIKPSFGQKVWEGTKAAGKYGYENAGNIARYAPIAANAYQLSQLEKPQGERLDRLSNRYKPEYVDEAALQNIANQTMNNSVNAIGQSGASQGQLRSSIIGSQLQRTKGLGEMYMNSAAQNRATNDRAQTFNLGVDQVNLNQSNTEKDINARDQAAYRNAKREYITGIGEGIGDIGKEQTQKKIIAKTLGYKWDGEYVKSPDGTVVTDPDTGKPMTGEKLKELQSTKDKKALGGYLIKNKRQ